MRSLFLAMALLLALPTSAQTLRQNSLPVRYGAPFQGSMFIYTYPGGIPGQVVLAAKSVWGFPFYPGPPANPGLLFFSLSTGPQIWAAPGSPILGWWLAPPLVAIPATVHAREQSIWWIPIVESNLLGRSFYVQAIATENGGGLLVSQAYSLSYW